MKMWKAHILRTKIPKTSLLQKKKKIDKSRVYS